MSCALAPKRKRGHFFSQVGLGSLRHLKKEERDAAGRMNLRGCVNLFIHQVFLSSRKGEFFFPFNFFHLTLKTISKYTGIRKHRDQSKYEEWSLREDVFRVNGFPTEGYMTLSPF